MSIFNRPQQGTQPATDWRDCYPAWAAVGLIPLRPPGESLPSGQPATGKEPIHNSWQTIPAQRKALNESPAETFNDIAHEIERGRNIGLVVPDGTIVLDLDDQGATDTVLSLYPDSPAQLTQGGGVHLFFRVKPGEQFSATQAVEIDGIKYDIRSAGRSQIACFPSTGLVGKYRWLRPLPIDQDELPLRPDGLLKYLTTEGPQTQHKVHNNYGPMPVPAKPLATAYKAIKQIDEALYQKIRQGQPLTREVGQRNNTMIRAVGLILGTCTPANTPPDPLTPFNILAESVLADQGSGPNPPPTLAELWSACCRLCDSETAKWIDTQSIVNAINRMTAQAQAAQDEVAAGVVAKAAEAMNIPPEELKKQAILYLPNGRHYYVFNEKTGGYAGPVASNGLLQRVSEGCTNLFNPADIYDLSPQGALSMRPLNEIIRDYGKPVTRVDRLAGLKYPLYDRLAETMVDGVWALRELEPAYNPLIDEWLKLLAGKEYSDLLIWLATVTDTHRPNSCLYLRGPKAIGKSLLVDGLARLWGRKATRYRDVMSRFNDSFVNCPLVHLDEGLSDQTDSLRFREFISEVEHVLETKGQPQFTVRGSARVIVTSNNVNALKINEPLNTDDIDAISSRIMWISAGSEAAEFLRKHQGRTLTEQWVEDDLIARHVLWLRDNVTVQTEGHENRFMVPGNHHPEKLLMLRTYRNNNTLFDVIANYVLEAATAKTGAFVRYDEGVKFVRGTVAVRWKGLAEYWSLNESRFGKLPGPRQVTDMFKILSKEKEVSQRTASGPRKFWLADYDLLMDEMERVTPTELLKTVEDFLVKSVDELKSKG